MYIPFFIGKWEIKTKGNKKEAHGTQEEYECATKWLLEQRGLDVYPCCWEREKEEKP